MSDSDVDDEDLFLEEDSDNEGLVVVFMKVYTTIFSSGGRKQVTMPNWKYSAISCSDLVHCIREEILPKINEDHIEVCAKLIREGTVFNGHPCYGQKSMARQEWCLAQFKENGQKTNLYPTHIVCFINLESKRGSLCGLPGHE